MLLQLPEEKKDLAKDLFKKQQPSWSALWCCLNGTMPAKIYVDNLETPAKAICVADWSWTWCSDDADFHWIEDILEEIKKRRLIPIWACDVANPESAGLAEKLGFKNPLAYDFLYYPQR